MPTMLTVVQPPSHLSQYIICFWFGRIENSTTAFTHLQHATTTPHLLFHLDGLFTEVESKQNIFHAGIYGHSINPKRYVTTSTQPSIFGIQLYPSAMSSLFGIPASEITNQAIELKALSGNNGVWLMEKIFEANTLLEIVQHSIQFFEQCLHGHALEDNKAIYSLMHVIKQSNGNISSTAMQDHACMSERQLQRKFKQITGFTPKMYSKIVRFESFLERFACSPNKLTDIATEFGYYDQAHCNHDFKTFTGLSPLQYTAFYADQNF
jgi:AraC-like DNA-binding protein